MLENHRVGPLKLTSLMSLSTQQVVVGGTAGLKFVPETITAEVGDFVRRRWCIITQYTASDFPILTGHICLPVKKPYRQVPSSLSHS